MLSITKLFTFESAHRLAGHQSCGETHGHSFRLEVTVTGPLDGYGMIVDFSTLRGVVQPFVDKLDHTVINKVMLMDDVSDGWDAPTAERLLVWFVGRITGEMLKRSDWPKKATLHRLRLYETAKNFAEWVPDVHFDGPYVVDGYDTRCLIGIRRNTEDIAELERAQREASDD